MILEEPEQNKDQLEDEYSEEESGMEKSLPKSLNKFSGYLDYKASLIGEPVDIKKFLAKIQENSKSECFPYENTVTARLISTV